MPAHASWVKLGGRCPPPGVKIHGPEAPALPARAVRGMKAIGRADDMR